MFKFSIFFLISLPFPSQSFSIYHDSFSSWASKYHENFQNSTQSPYIDAYQHNIDLINEHNSKDDDFEAALNQFSYLSTEQFVDNFCGTMLPKKLLSTHPALLSARKLNDYDEDNLPESISWQKYASPVRDQGSECGSCWAFSVMQLIETQNRIRSSKWNKTLAPQYLVDCHKKKDKCRGEWPTDALRFLKKKSRNRAPEEEDYPYTGEEDSCESYGVEKIPLNIKNIYEYSLDADENKLKYHLANYGPIIITINVDKKSGLFQHYKTGVFYDERCRKSDNDCKTINHSVLLLGYGVTNDKKRKPYFLVQNSWGTKWGEDGYIRMAMGKDNNCNIACYAIYVDYSS
ncbi:cathepsin K-like [Chironomus tepperi]|uniref:cathepsin K-like n=1 Tax=Chironomus tepperi TaxID=113505 RepID=UPI00391F9C60